MGMSKKVKPWERIRKVPKEDESEYEKYLKEHRKRLRQAQREASGENLEEPEQ